MSKIAPGPWTASWTNDVGPDDEYYVEFYEILDAQGNRVGTAEEEADAKLMALAPELLEALKLAEQSIGSFVSDHGWSQRDMDILDTVTAAIAKATGELK